MEYVIEEKGIIPSTVVHTFPDNNQGGASRANVELGTGPVILQYVTGLRQ